jgi:hypothetical protein
MNPGFAVAAVTVTVADRLLALIGDAVPGARVTTLNPGSEALRGGDPIVNLYLFRTVRNGFVSNDDLPTRSADGRVLHSPVTRLDLDYMITFFGDDARLDPQRLLGLVVGGLHADPVIGRDAIRATVAATPWLGGGEEQPAGEPIRVTPLNLPPDAMARLWSEFVNVPYQLTQLYTVTPVALVVELPVEPVLPVRRIGLDVVPSSRIAIHSVVNAADPALPLVAGGTMAIRLADPAAPNSAVRLNGVTAGKVSAGFDADGFASLLVPLSADQPGGLAVGPLAVQVVRKEQGKAGIVAQSEVVRTTILPALAEAPSVGQGSLSATMALLVPAEAEAAVLLFPRGAPGLPARRIPCLPRTMPSATLAAPLAGVSAGAYLVSVEIDGLATLLEHSGSAYVGPTVEVPAAA